MLKIRWVPSRGYITDRYQNCPVCSSGASHSHININYYPLPPQLEHKSIHVHTLLVVERVTPRPKRGGKRYTLTTVDMNTPSRPHPAGGGKGSTLTSTVDCGN
jgi:hypothetical protein